jgi:hypothetical protein
MLVSYVKRSILLFFDRNLFFRYKSQKLKSYKWKKHALSSIRPKILPSRNYLHSTHTSWLTIKFWSLIRFNQLRKKLWFIQFYQIGEKYVSILLSFWYWAARNDERNIRKKKWNLKSNLRETHHLTPINFAISYKQILIYVSIYFFFLNKKFAKKSPLMKEIFHLYLRTRSAKPRISLVDSIRFSLFSITGGVLNSITQREKKSKKSKLVRILLFKYIQKLLLFSRITSVIPFLRGSPLYWYEMIQILNSDLQPFFRDYLINLSKTTYKRYLSRISFPLVIFQYATKYSFTKIRNKGRIKRKITRKLIRTSQIDV